MTDTGTNAITVETVVNAPVEKTWELWTEPRHIEKWNAASDDWQSRNATNDLRMGGSFSCRMEAKDGSMGFDFAGVYDEVDRHKLIRYTMEDGRKVKVSFRPEGNRTRVVETFDPEGTNPAEMQRAGWQAILDNFRKYADNK